VNALRLCGLTLASLLAARESVAPEGKEGPRPTIEDLEVRESDDALRVSFGVEGAFAGEVQERMESGLTVTFSHRVELLARRALPIVPSRVLARAIVDSTARYDSLTRQYYLSRKTTRESSRAMESVEEETSLTTVSRSEAEAEAWLTTLQDLLLPAPPPSATGRRLRVRVRTILGRRYHLGIFPANDSVDAEHVLAP